MCVGGIYDAAGAKVALSRVYKKKGLSIYITGGSGGAAAFNDLSFCSSRDMGGAKDGAGHVYNLRRNPLCFSSLKR